MTCNRLDEVLREDATPDAIAHTKTCPTCGPARAAWNKMNGPAESAGPLDAIREAARAEFKKQPKQQPWWVDAATLMAMNLILFGLAISLLSSPLLHSESPVMRWGNGAGLFVLMVTGAWFAIRPGGRQVWLALLGLAALGAVGVSLGGSGDSGHKPFASGLACAATEVAVSILPVIAAVWMTRKFAFDLTRTIASGLSVGATGMLVLHLHCANGGAAHLFVFHVMAWAVVAAGVVLARRLALTRSYAN